MQHCILAHVSRSIAFEHDRSGLWRGGLLRATADFLQPLFTFFLGKPDDLKRTVAFNGAGSVVVDGFARSRKQARSRIVVIHDEHGVRFVALKGDADYHLPDRGSSEGVSAAEGL